MFIQWEIMLNQNLSNIRISFLNNIFKVKIDKNKKTKPKSKPLKIEGSLDDVLKVSVPKKDKETK